MTTDESPRVDLVCACGRRHTIDVGAAAVSNPERRVSLAAASAATGVSRWTLRRLALAREIQAVRGARNAILVKVSDVRSWLDSRPVGLLDPDVAPSVNLLDAALQRADRPDPQLARTVPMDEGDDQDLDHTG